MSTAQSHARFHGPLPIEVVNCLKNARFLHLATCNNDWPHVALMNYTYVDQESIYRPENDASTSTEGPGVIVMLLAGATTKQKNLLKNPRVSLLVHDWVSHRPSQSITDPASTTLSSSPPNRQARSSLAELLQNLNSSSLSTHSHTIRGYARILDANSDEEKYYRQKHVEGNRGEEVTCYIEGDEESRVVVVEVEGGREADWRGSITDWGIMEGSSSTHSNGLALTNGV